MDERNTKVVLTSLAVGALMLMGPGPSWAGIPMNPLESEGMHAATSISDSAPIVLAGGGHGNRHGRGEGVNATWRRGDSSGSGNSYGLQDGSGSAPRPRDGTGYGAKNGSGSGTCDGTGPKGKGRGGQS
ncbi:conserved exported hypothetical protein [uncultured Desulfatiglans sp.]|nr:conserved exported hypothetical protein [uncultured Desulfatiglans sp.]